MPQRRAPFAQSAGLRHEGQLAPRAERGAWIIALPMKIAGGSGGPLRVVALVAQ